MRTWENYETSHSVMRCLSCGQEWIAFDHREKNHLLSTFCSFKNKLLLWLFFQTLSLFSRLFPGLENCWENFELFSRIQDFVQTLFVVVLKDLRKLVPVTSWKSRGWIYHHNITLLLGYLASSSAAIRFDASCTWARILRLADVCLESALKEPI